MGRFIPASAGNTPLGSRAAAPWSVHPRWRGEHSSASCSSSATAGSSPLARGTRRWRPRPCPRAPVHPRWRGEHVVEALPLPKLAGSSPLARGTHERQHCRHPQRRFIPAGAGNTPASASDSSPCAVHPRWRGEHSARTGMSKLARGSSPLARGTRVGSASMVMSCRFIPAGAGNTRTHTIGAENATVHPRWRGEHAACRLLAADQVGSSPLARGTRPRRHIGAKRQRFIPAGAGNTTKPRPASTHEPVHPRWRGEHLTKD